MLSSLWSLWVNPYRYMVVVTLLAMGASFFLPLSNKEYSTIAFIVLVGIWGA